jgi:hypothetical protein
MRPARIRISGTQHDLTSGGRVRGRGRFVARVAVVVLAVLGIAASSVTAAAAQRYAPVSALSARGALGTAAGAANPFTFVGMTSQFPCKMGTDNPLCGRVNVFMAKGMASVKHVLVGFEAPCDSRDHFFGTTWVFTKMPAKRSRHNTVASFSNQVSEDRPLDGGLTAHAENSVAARVKLGAKGSGVFSATIKVMDQAGQVIDTCTTGLLAYGLSALKRV